MPLSIVVKKSQETLLYLLQVLPKRSRDYSAQDRQLANQMPLILLTFRFPRMFFDVRFCFKSNQRRRSKSRRISNRTTTPHRSSQDQDGLLYRSPLCFRSPAELPRRRLPAQIARGRTERQPATEDMVPCLEQEGYPATIAS